jgi:hypothetical protein
MNDLRFTLTTDGSSDCVLLRHLEWILRRAFGTRVAIQPQWADLRSLRRSPKSLSERVRVALELYPCDLLFVHRDAESADSSPRYEEIKRAVAEVGVSTPTIPVVPVRMTEAWLLFDEQAVRSAAGNPNGRMAIDLPTRNPETIADPKALLHDALRRASGLAGRRFRNLRTGDAVHRVAEYIDDFSPLQDLAAFQSLCDRVAEVARSQGWLVSQPSSAGNTSE